MIQTPLNHISFKLHNYIITFLKYLCNYTKTSKLPSKHNTKLIKGQNTLTTLPPPLLHSYTPPLIPLFHPRLHSSSHHSYTPYFTSHSPPSQQHNKQFLSLSLELSAKKKKKRRKIVLIFLSTFKPLFFHF